MKTFKGRTKSLMWGFVVIVLGVACGMAVVVGYRTVAADFTMMVAKFASAASSAPPVSASAFADSVGAPSELVIPKIGVDAPVMSVGIAADGDLAVPPDATHVAWYKGGPRPGEQGAAVIDGHLDTIHSPQAVFYNLGQLSAGDEIDVKTASGQKLVFKVTAVKTVAYNASTTEIFTNDTKTPELNLITCAGDWMPSKKLYNERFVVFSQLVSVTSS